MGTDDSTSILRTPGSELMDDVLGSDGASVVVGARHPAQQLVPKLPRHRTAAGRLGRQDHRGLKR